MAAVRKTKEVSRRGEVRRALEGGADDATIKEVVSIVEAEAEAGMNTDQFEAEEDALSVAFSGAGDEPAIEESQLASETVIGNERFVRLRDVLPPCPPRGMFDVERIRDSQYFFS